MTEMQKEAILALSQVWSLSPDIRLGQLMAHLDFLCESYLDKGLGYVDDDELIAILYRHRAELQTRLENSEVTASPTLSAAVSVSGSSTVPLTLPTIE